MEKFLQAAALAWNPIGEVRRRMENGSLTVGSVLVPYLSIVIACNLFLVGAEKFFFETIYAAMQMEVPSHPLTRSDYALRLMSAILVLVPAGAVALLPKKVFYPPGRSATIAAMLVVAAGWAFYGAGIGVPVYFFAGTLATMNPELGINALFLLGFPMNIAIVGLTLFFWFRIMISALNLDGAQVTAITLTALIAGSSVVAFFVFVILSSLS